MIKYILLIFNREKTMTKAFFRRVFEILDENGRKKQLYKTDKPC